MKQNINHNRV